MRSSRHSTERGATLLEVAIASALLAVVLSVSMSQVTEATDATKVTAAQADLRRVAGGVLERIVRDLRSTQARFVATDASTIELYKITDFEPNAEVPLLAGPLGSVPPPAANG